MKTYRFESALSPARIRIRLEAFAKQARAGWRLEDGGKFYYKFYNDTHFFLIKTRVSAFGGASMNQRVFLGTITETDGGSEIRGRFGTERGIAVIAFSELALLFCLFRPSIFMLVIFILWAAFALWLTRTLSARFYRREEAEVIEFIENNLIK